MGLNRINYCLVLLCFFASLSSATFFSDGKIFGERRLLHAKKKCAVRFDFQNYTILTSRCKAPDYPVNACCEAFKEFACPYAKQLNDLTNCASSMFKYIHKIYPPGLFATQCREVSQGLECHDPPPAYAGNDA